METWRNNTIEEETIAETITRLYFSQNSEDRHLAYQFLGEIGIIRPKHALSAMKLLLKALVDKNVINQEHGIYYLGEIGAISSSLSKHLVYSFVMLLLQPNLKPVIEFYILNALEKLNKDSDEVKDFLERGVSDIAYLQVSKLSLQDANERQTAAWRIGKLGAIFFPAVIDLIPALVNRLIDDDDTVKIVTYKALLDLLLQKREDLLKILIENLDTIDNPFLKLQVISLLGDFVKKEPRFIEVVLPLVIKEIEHPNRVIHVKIQKILKSIERASPGIFVKKFKPILVALLKSSSRYAYHWAVMTFTSSLLTELHEQGATDIGSFIDENVSLVDMLNNDHRGNLMQTRVILMMLVHETKETFMKATDANSLAVVGIVESLSQIQKSGLTSETEVVAAYEKLKTILKNSKIILGNGESSF
ncbi:MAG TPA: hypothetical protein VKM55_22465 [Candidatus Lokiarchaeia archaeon]|nr:hypothetical protein [Candidatus Lokiarchaeia archaeon]